MQIPLINEHLFCNYFVRLSVGNATKGFATYGCFHPCITCACTKMTQNLVFTNLIMLVYSAYTSNGYPRIWKYKTMDRILYMFVMKFVFYVFVKIHISRSCVKKGALLAQLFKISNNYTDNTHLSQYTRLKVFFLNFKCIFLHKGEKT